MKRLPAPARSIVLLACVVLLCAGCITGRWESEHRFLRPPPGSIGSLEPRVHDLEQCLERLGAPLFVYETPDGFALAYGWYKSRGLGGSLSMPVSEAANASFSIHDIDDRMKGLVLFFGPQTELLLMQRGPLRDLTAGAERVRPALLDD